MIESQNSSVTYVLDPTAAEPWRYTFDFRCWASGDLQVWLYDPVGGTSEQLAEGGDYIVELTAGSDGGAVILNPASSRFAGGLPDGWKLAIMRVLPISQDINLPENGKLPSAGIEGQLDKTIMILQQHQEELGRAVKVPPGAETDRNLDAYVRLAAKYAHDAQVYASGGTVTGGMAYTSGAKQFRDTASAHADIASGHADTAIDAAEAAGHRVHDAEVYASGGTLTGGTVYTSGAADYAAIAAANRHDAQVYASGGTLTGGTAYTSGAKQYAEAASMETLNRMRERDVLTSGTLNGSAVTGGYMVIPGAGQMVHDLAEMLVSGAGGVSCVIPYENGHIYSGSFPITGQVGGETHTTSKVYLTPGAGTLGGTMCTFELHLKHGNQPSPITIVNGAYVWWYNPNTRKYAAGNAQPDPAAGTVQCFTVRGKVPARVNGTWGVFPNGTDFSVIRYLVNEALVFDAF